MEDPRGEVEGLPMDMAREVVRRWMVDGTVVVGQCEGGGRMVQGPCGEAFRLREEGVGGLLPFEDDIILVTGGDEEDPEEIVFGVDGEEKEVMPGSRGRDREYLYRGVRRLVVNSVLELADLEADGFGTASMMPGWLSEVWRRRLEALADMLDEERMAHLRLRWNAMDRLDTLFLDLRGYSLPRNNYLFDEDVARIARSLEGKGLALLVIAGLRSWWRYPGPDPMEMDKVQEGVLDPEFKVWETGAPEHDVNWWRMFSGAVRPDGRLVFVDKQGGNDPVLLDEDPELRADWTDQVV